ncbi:hypothetical protein GCM10022222_51460 [Amycolatopsis ultiminotia]|uniref:Endonuclease/exonuclease/phosphatase domain-containing protein n=1 Tax=Amycolatopsis ultiminotia TaxID=543629 RepID=A0ABP6X5N8_9PSEU
MTSLPMRLRVATLNHKRGGYDRDSGIHDFGAVRDSLSTLEQPPHVLFMPECTYYTKFRCRPFFEFLELLQDLWGMTTTPDGQRTTVGRYQGWISTVPGSINVPGLFVETRFVRPREWYEHDEERKLLANTLLADINGHEIRLKCEHWNGSDGATGFDQQASRSGQLAQYRSLTGGDFNAAPTHPDATYPEDWGAHCDAQGTPWKRSQKGIRTSEGWKVHTTAYDAFLEHGWRDAAIEAGDLTPTVNPAAEGTSGMCIDHIAWSTRAPITLVPGSYRVHVRPGTHLSDHWLVSCELDIAPAVP